MHKSHNPNPIWLVKIDDRKRENAGKMVACRRIEDSVTLGVGTNFGDQSFYMIVEARGELWIDRCVVPRGVNVLFFGVGMKYVPLHRPTIWRMRAETVSPSTG